MALQGVIGNDTRVGFSAASPTTYTRIPQVLDVKFPGLTPDKLDRTVMSSGNFYQNFQGLNQVSDAEVLILDDPDEVTSPILETLRTLHEAGTTVYFAFERPTNRAKTRFRKTEYQGYISDFVPATPLKDKQTLMIKIVFSDTAFSVYPAGNPTIV